MESKKPMILIAIMVLIFSTLMAAPNLLLMSTNADGTCGISGTVTNATSGDPILGAEDQRYIGGSNIGSGSYRL